jgi:hypothetical protein
VAIVVCGLSLPCGSGSRLAYPSNTTFTPIAAANEQRLRRHPDEASVPGRPRHGSRGEELRGELAPDRTDLAVGG